MLMLSVVHIFPSALKRCQIEIMILKCVGIHAIRQCFVNRTPNSDRDIN